jgi:cullin-4
MTGIDVNSEQSTIRSVFLYLDRSYLFSSPNRQSIEATGVSLFRKHIANSKELENKYLAGVFALFEQDRQNRGADSMNFVLLNSCVQMISSLGLYSSNFEPLFVSVARDYYSKLVESESQAQGLTTYIRECADQLEREVKRCDKFRLELSTKRQTIAVLEDEMVRKNVDVLTDKARVRELLNRRDFESLGTLYQLLDRVGGAGEALKPAWATYIVEEGTMIITDKERQIEMVKRLLDFKGILDSVWTESFGGSDIMGYSLRESFNTFINSHREGETMTDRSRPAEMIAKYVDLLLRQGSRGLPPVAGLESRMESIANDDAMLAFRLELVLDLFRFIQGKDVFEAFYKKDLARRLLMGRSASVDAERLMLTKLKTGTFQFATLFSLADNT